MEFWAGAGQKIQLVTRVNELLAVVAAFREEIGGYLKSGGFRKIAQSGEVRLYASDSVPHVVVADGGFGGAGAGDCVAEVITRFDPHLVVSAGFAAGTRAGQPTGSVVICDRLLSVEGPAYLWRRQVGKEIEVNPHLVRNVRTELQTDGKSVQLGSCMTVPQFVSNPSMKAWIGSTFGVSLIDMEGYWAALAAEDANVPFLPLRIVLDTVDQHVSPLVSQSLEDGPVRRVVRGTGFMAAHPGDIRGLLAMGRQTTKARRTLASYLNMLAQTPMAVRAG